MTGEVYKHRRLVPQSGVAIPCRHCFASRHCVFCVDMIVIDKATYPEWVGCVIVVDARGDSDHVKVLDQLFSAQQALA